MTPAEVEALVLAFPETERGTSYGQPSFKAAGKFFTRLRAEDDSLVLHVASTDWRDLLIEAEPATFHITDHYRGYPIVLARIGPVDPAWLKATLAARWRTIAPKRLARAHPEMDADG